MIEAEKLSHRNRVLLGIICIVISGFGFSAMQLFVRLAGDMPSVQKTFFRNLVASVIVLIPLLKSKTKLNIKKKNIFPLFLRAIFGTCGIVLNFYAVEHLKLADASILQKISPFVVIILSLIFLKEKVKPYQWAAVFIAFIGILFVVKPGINGIMNKGAAAALLGAVAAGAAYTALRYLNLQGVKKEFIILFFSVFSCVSLLPLVIIYYKPMTKYQIMCLFMIGVCATIGQFGVTYAYYFSKASEISVFEYSQVVFAGILGYLFLGQIPDLHSLIGYIIIISVGIVMVKKRG